METSPWPWRDQSIGMVKALRTPEAGGHASRQTHVELLIIDLSPAKRGLHCWEGVESPSTRCAVEACRVLLKPWSPRPVICCQPHKPAETCRERPQAVEKIDEEPLCTV
jgi:hypothetical protein